MRLNPSEIQFSGHEKSLKASITGMPLVSSTVAKEGIWWERDRQPGGEARLQANHQLRMIPCQIPCCYRSQALDLLCSSVMAHKIAPALALLSQCFSTAPCLGTAPCGQTFCGCFPAIAWWMQLSRTGPVIYLASPKAAFPSALCSRLVLETQ